MSASVKLAGYQAKADEIVVCEDWREERAGRGKLVQEPLCRFVFVEAEVALNINRANKCLDNSACLDNEYWLLSLTARELVKLELLRIDGFLL